MATPREQADAKKALGNEEFNNRNYEASIDLYTQAIELDSTNHVYYSNRSASYGALGKWELAAQDAAKCIELNPQFKKGYHRLAAAQRKLGQQSQALATLQQAQQLDGSNSETARLMKDIRKDLQANSNQNITLTPAVSKELEELQPKFNSVHRELEQIQHKLQALKRDKKRFELTLKDVSDLPESTKTYRNVGKMFLQMQPNETQQHVRNQIKDTDDQEAALEARKQYLERQKASIEENISELLSQCRT